MATMRKHEHEHELYKAKVDFDQTKAGVKGLLDSGVLKIPQIFVHPPETVLQNPSSCNVSDLQVPVIDFETIGGEIVDEIRNAAGKWGIFQVINHGIVASVMEEMIEAVSWRDSISCHYADGALDPNQLPHAFRYCIKLTLTTMLNFTKFNDNHRVGKILFNRF
ncbi:hypothetical protein LXL04_004386 [Taraxacum kok-saghyz]